MIKVLWTTGFLLIFWTGALCAAKAFGTAQPNPLALWFSQPDGSACSAPCLFGITPGVTPYDDAIKLLAKHPVTRDLHPDMANTQYDQGLLLENDLFCLDMSPGVNNRVAFIRLSWLCPSFTPADISWLLTAAQVSSLLGAPSSVWVGIYGGNPDHYYFLHGQIDLYLTIQGNICAVPLQSSQLRFRSLAFLATDIRPPGAFSAWKGFASRTKYLRTADTAARLAGCHS